MLRDNPAASLVDVRTDAEWRFVGLPDLTGVGREPVCISWVDTNGTVNHDFAAQLAARVPAGPVLFLCRSGNRSIAAAQLATAAGVTPAYNVLDGFEGNLDAAGHRGVTGWKAVGLPWTQS